MLWTSLTFRVIVQLDRSRQSGGYVLCGVGTGVPSVTKDITVGRAFPFARGQSKYREYEPSSVPGSSLSVFGGLEHRCTVFKVLDFLWQD